MNDRDTLPKNDVTFAERADDPANAAGDQANQPATRPTPPARCARSCSTR
jgi:hypothetical protein